MTRALALGVVAGGLAVLPQQAPPFFSSHADPGVLHVPGTDRPGQVVPYLSQDCFTVTDAGSRRPVTFFTARDAPATVGLIVDDSGSMYGVRDEVAAAAAAFVDASNPDDEHFALTFNEQIRAALPAA